MRKRVDWWAVSIFKWYLPGYFVFFIVPALFGGHPSMTWPGHVSAVVILAFMTGWMLPLSNIWIDGEKLIIMRFGTTIEIDRHNVGDWEAHSWPPVSRLHFLCATPLGMSILFLPKRFLDWTYGGVNTDSYDLLADFKKVE